MGVLYIATLAMLFTIANADMFGENDDVLDTLKDRYEDYVEGMMERKELKNMEKRGDVLEKAVDKDGNGNRDTCDAVGVKCHHCTQCWPGGWCVTGKTGQPRCLCKHGWIGPNAHYVTDSDPSIPPEGRNRAYANSCDYPCHYTHDFRNSDLKSCLIKSTISTKPTQQEPQCHKKCNRESYGRACLSTNYKYTGKYRKCLCCRGWTGPGAFYDQEKNSYVADYCNKECPYLGKGIPNPTCKSPVDPITHCDPKCALNGGKCDTVTGRCECCYGWTGPRPSYEQHNRIHADYCDVYCQYSKTNKNPYCVNENYIERLRKNPNRVLQFP